MPLDQVREVSQIKKQTLTVLYRGWDDLFNKCSENLNSLTAMKLSPYYKGEKIFGIFRWTGC